MRLISQTFYTLISMMLTGTLALGIWWMIRKICKGRYPELVYLILRMVCLLYLVPVVYFMMRLTVRDGYINREGMWGWDFMLTGIEWKFGMIICVAWFVFMLRNLFLFLLRSIWEKARLWDTSTPEDDPEVAREFLRVKRKLKICRSVRLFRSSCLASPATGGVFTGVILLPNANFTKEELSVIFHHELIHYRQRDRLFHLLGRFAGIVLGTGIMPGKLPELLTEWSEICCDRRAVIALRDEMDERRYFEIIVNIMEKVSDRYSGEFVYSSLYESPLRLERRIDYMMSYKKRKPVAKGAAALAAFAFAALSVSTTYAAGIQIAEVHDYVYELVETTDEEPAGGDSCSAPEEIYLPAEQDDTYDSLVYGTVEYEEDIMPLLDANEMATFNWTVKPGTRYISRDFYVKSGQTINISASTIPNDTVYWIGIMDKWNNVRYVAGPKNLSHDFAISSSGNYCVLVQNRGTVDITSSGSYYFY